MTKAPNDWDEKFLRPTNWPFDSEADEIKFVTKAQKNAARQRRFRERLKEDGRVVMTIDVHSHQLAGLMDLIRALKADPDLEAGPAKNTRTGRLVKVR